MYLWIDVYMYNKICNNFEAKIKIFKLKMSIAFECS